MLSVKVFFNVFHEYLSIGNSTYTVGKTGPDHNWGETQQHKKGKKTMKIRLRCHGRGINVWHLGVEADIPVYMRNPTRSVT